METRAPGLRQHMAGLHAWAGVLAGWLLYAIFNNCTFAWKNISHKPVFSLVICFTLPQTRNGNG